MNIIGIGSDIVAIARIRKIHERYGQIFADRLLAPAEGIYYRAVLDPVAFLAKRFAAKESVAKALGTGFRAEGVLLQHIEIHKEPSGRPYVVLKGGALKEQERQQIQKIHLSLSDEREFALAFVVLLGLE
jgi:holo-[acyl-carrier protein] synthase